MIHRKVCRRLLSERKKIRSVRKRCNRSIFFLKVHFMYKITCMHHDEDTCDSLERYCTDPNTSFLS